MANISQVSQKPGWVRNTKWLKQNLHFQKIPKEKTGCARI
jgi:hypothetical protein